ncbi:MAG TPA: DUF819 family protein [Longimicrobiales bacterium]
MIDQPLALAAAIAGITALAFWLDRRFAWARKAGATLLVIAFGAILSNLGLVAPASPVYGAITGPVTSLAIVWLLLAVDLRDLRAAGPRMLGAFTIASVATVIGAIIATRTFADAFPSEAWKLAGVLTGTYIGGSLNFVAVGRELGLPDTLFTAATAADNVVTALWMAATLMLPVWLDRFYPAGGLAGQRPMARPGGSVGEPRDSGTGQPALVPAGAALDVAAPDGATAAREVARGGEIDAAAVSRGTEDDEAAARRPSGDDRDAPGSHGADGEDAAAAEHPFFGAASLRLLDVALLLALGFALLVAADAVAARIPAIPAVLWLTTFALAVAQLPAVRRLSGAMQLGTLALHFFFAVIGIGSRVAEIARVGPEIFYFTAMVVAVHGVLIYGGARMARLDVATASVASQAAVGGPSSALALAAAREWPALVLPGTVAGLLGYAVGNYLGFGVAYLMRAWVGG